MNKTTKNDNLLDGEADIRSLLLRWRSEGGREKEIPTMCPPIGMSGAKEIFSPQKHLRPSNVYLTELAEDDGGHCLILCTVPAGAVVPMHSHADRETFYVISGKMDALRADRWETLGPGDVFDVRDGIKHAWRNSSPAAATMLCVTTNKLARFLQDISPSDDDISPDEQAQRFLRLVRANGYWLASPEENAAVGLTVNWNGPGD